MRHRIGIVLAIVMAGVLFFAGSWGYLRLLRLPAPAVPLSGLPAGGGSLLSFHGVLAALAAVAATGMLAGIRGYRPTGQALPNRWHDAGYATMVQHRPARGHQVPQLS